mgnify:CR=1 FL=1
MKKVSGYNHLYRNETGAIVSTDDSGYHAYKAKRAALADAKTQVSNLGNDLKEAKAEIEELKSLVKELLNKQVQ